MSINSDDKAERSIVRFRISNKKVAGLPIDSFEKFDSFITRHVRFIPEALGSSIMRRYSLNRVSTRARHSQRDSVSRDSLAKHAWYQGGEYFYLNWYILVCSLLGVELFNASDWNFCSVGFASFPDSEIRELSFCVKSNKDQVFSPLSSTCLSGNNFRTVQLCVRIYFYSRVIADLLIQKSISLSVMELLLNF